MELFLGFGERESSLGSFLKGPPLISGRCCQPWLGAWTCCCDEWKRRWRRQAMLWRDGGYGVGWCGFEMGMGVGGWGCGRGKSRGSFSSLTSPFVGAWALFSSSLFWMPLPVSTCLLFPYLAPPAPVYPLSVSSLGLSLSLLHLPFCLQALSATSSRLPKFLSCSLSLLSLVSSAGTAAPSPTSSLPCFISPFLSPSLSSCSQSLCLSPPICSPLSG